MLLIKTYLGVSKLDGIGLFAAEKIKKGTQIWRYNEKTTQVFWKKQFLSACSQLSTHAIKDFIKRSHLKDGNVYYLNDDSRFINHSLNPNTGLMNSKLEVALKDIEANDEILRNYLISYDDNDFFKWERVNEIQSKSELIQYIKERLLTPVKNNSFLIDTA